MGKTVIQGIPMSHIALGLSVLMFICIIPAVLSPEKFRKAVNELLNADNNLIRFAGLVNLIFAFLILNTHWTIKFSSTRSIMTVIGYLFVLRGICHLWFPEYSRNLKKKILQKDSGFYAVVALGFAFAVGLGYLGMSVY